MAVDLLIPDPSQALSPTWYQRPVEAVARDLLGCLIVAERADGLTCGLIVETEAYGDAEDPASHASFRRTGVVRAMWGPPGTTYVYIAYGYYPCLNVVTGEHGEPAAVLIRAITPVEGRRLMAERSGRAPNARIGSGPGLTALALGVTPADNEHPLDRPPLWIQPGIAPREVAVGRRIGVRRGVEQPWRFGVAAHPALSRHFPRGR